MKIPILVKRILWTENDLIVFVFAFLEAIEIINIKLALKNCINLRDYVNLVFSWRSLSIRPIQIKEEITKLLKILEIKKPRRILEIGTSGGGTLFLLSRVSSSDALIVSMNIPTDGFGGGGYPRWRLPLYRSFAKNNQRLIFIRENSHTLTSFQKIKELLQGNQLDFLLIDGDHTYEGVKLDFEMYSGLVARDGVIAFHDIVTGPEKDVGGVPRFWKEIKLGYKHSEIVKNWEQGGCGIGLIYKA